MAMYPGNTYGSLLLTANRRERSIQRRKRKKKRSTYPPGQMQGDTAAAGSTSISGADAAWPMDAGSWLPQISKRKKKKKHHQGKNKRRSLSEHYNNAPPTSTGQAKADTAAAGPPSVGGADSTWPVEGGSWPQGIWTREKKTKKHKKSNKRLHSLPPSPTGQGKAERLLKSPLHQYVLEQAGERQTYQIAQEVKNAYEKKQEEQLQKLMLAALSPEQEHKSEKSPRLQELEKARDIDQNAQPSKMSPEQQDILRIHEREIEHGQEIERKNFPRALKQVNESEADLQLQLDKVQLERAELLKRITEHTDTYNQFQTKDHRRGFETELQRPTEELSQMGRQGTQCYQSPQPLKNLVLVRGKPFATLFAPPGLEAVLDAKIASRPAKNTSIEGTVILGEDNPAWNNMVGSGKGAVIEKTTADISICPKMDRSLIKAPPIATIRGTSGSQGTSPRNDHFLCDTTININHGTSLSAQKGRTLEKAPDDVNLLATALDRPIDTFHVTDREYKKDRSSTEFKDELSNDILPKIPPSQYSELPGPATVVEAVEDCLQAMEDVVITVASSTDKETAYLRSLRAIEDRSTTVGDPTDRTYGKGLSSACQLIESIKRCVGNAMNRHLSNVQAFTFCAEDPLISDVERGGKTHRKKNKGKNKTGKHKKRKQCKTQSGRTEGERKKSGGKKTTLEHKNISKNDRKWKEEAITERGGKDSNFTPPSIPSPYTSSEDLYGEKLEAPGRQWSYPCTSDGCYSKCRATKRTSSCCYLHHGTSRRPVMVEPSLTIKGPYKQDNWLDALDGRPSAPARTGNRWQWASSTALSSQCFVRSTHSYDNVTSHPPRYVSSNGTPATYKWKDVTYEPRGAHPPVSDSVELTVMKPHARMQSPLPDLRPHISLTQEPQLGVHLILPPHKSSLPKKVTTLAFENETTSTIAPLYAASAPQLGNYQSIDNTPRGAAVSRASRASQDRTSLVALTYTETTPAYFDDILSRNPFIQPCTVLTRQVGQKNIGLAVLLVVGIVICAITLFGHRDHSPPSARNLIPAEDQGAIMQGPWLFNLSSITSPLAAHAYKLCDAADCKQEANRLTRVLASGPCSNFYDFVCSRRWESAQFTAEARSTEDAAIQEIRDGIWKHIGKTENSTCAAVAIWEACMDTLAIGSEGAAPFRDALNASGLEGWPFFIAPLELDPWCVAGNFMRLFDLAAMFSISIEHSVSQRLLVRLGNGYTLLSLRDFGNNVSATPFLRRVERAINFLAPELNETSILAVEVFNVALHLGKLQAPNNGTPAFKVGISIKHFLQAAFKDIINLSRESIRFTFESPRYAKELEQMIMAVAPRTVLNYLGFYLVQHLWTFSPHDAAETLPNGWRERKCLHMAERAVPSQVLEIGWRVYMKRLNFTHFSVLGDETRRRLIRSIAFLPWMDHEMKAALIENLNTVRVQFMLPKQVHSNCSTPSEDSPPHLQSSSAVTVYQRAVQKRLASTILSIARGGDAEQLRGVFSTQIEVDAEGTLYVPLAAAASVLRRRGMSPYVALMRETVFIVRLARAVLQAVFARINNYQAAWTPSAYAHYQRVQECFQKHFSTLRDPLTGVVVPSRHPRRKAMSLSTSPSP
ncbi:hypothetical protein HPB48_018677 [Haemaphysalis longicornis]|uniref:Peptidase M13 N-terminal domain-containing protein n=1 Tax=Haemaphysalis longicornis TaxID=44386 RepID=A0A9J6G5L2_HAELO|nr:hypothetical protein HPB48_018677 [Haemaphysalis longicornis]